MTPDNEYWAYLRHVEALRFQVVGVLTAIGGAGIALAGANETAKAEERLWMLLGLGLLLGLAGLLLVAQKTRYDEYFRLLRRSRPLLVPRPSSFLQDVFTWLLGMMTVLGAGVFVATHLVGYQNHLKLGRVAGGVPIVFAIMWWVWYAATRR